MARDAVFTQNAGSFRDPAGFVFSHDGVVYRQVNRSAQADYDLLQSSGLYDKLVDEGLMVAHTELGAADVSKLAGLRSDPLRYKIIQPTHIPFISYPYEWSFDQLRAAALLTLRVLEVALDHGMILKDASAYNIQFIGNQPVFIDTLSFAAYQDGQAWEGYKQFSEHFVGPLALAHYATPDLLKIQRAYLDGIPLAVTARLLPKRARLNRGLLSHVYLHHASSKRYQGNQVADSTAPKRKVSMFALRGIVGSLQSTVKRMRPPSRKTEWGDYYSFTNYSDSAFKLKRSIVKQLLQQALPGSDQSKRTVWDVGANNGEFSEVAAEMGAYTVAFDIDEIAVTRNFRAKREAAVASRMLPLVQDLTNPSPGLGWNGTERESLQARGPADVVLALAIIHHLAIGNNVPFPQMASFFAGITNYLIIEFVPKHDSKVQILLSSRKDIFDQYDPKHFEAAMGAHFRLVDKVAIKGSERTMYLFQNKTIKTKA